MGYPNDARQAGNYTGGLANVNEYTIVPGVCVLPLAEDEPNDLQELADYSPVVVLRLHAQYRLRKFNQIAGKERNPAPIAAPRDTGGFAFLRGAITIKSEVNATYNDLNWFVGCEYLFVENCTPVDALGNPLGLVLGMLPFQTTIDASNEQRLGINPPDIGAAALGGAAVTSGWIGGVLIANPQTGALNPNWSYSSQAFYPSQLFYTDLPNGGTPVALGGLPGQ